MFVQLFDRRPVRFSVGLVVGVPVTIVALFGALYGIAIGVGSLGGGPSWFMAWAPAGVLGLLGVAGAWRRIMKTNHNISADERRIIRGLIWSGIAAPGFMAAHFAVFPDTRWFLTPVFLALVLVGVLFLAVTPVR